MIGKISGRYVKDENGKMHSISKNETCKFENDTEVEYELDNEYPASCDTFCDGDETCIICYHENVVAKIKK